MKLASCWLAEIFRMTLSVIEYTPTPDDVRIARLTAAAIALSVAEAVIPLPLPGVKPGLGNIITLVVLHQWGWRDAVWVSLLRVLGTSLLLGQFLAPGFFLSLSGAICSLFALGAVHRLPSQWFGAITHSVVAAFAHMSGQLAVARLWLVPHDGVFYLVPIFGIAALFFGTLNGLIAANLIQQQSPPSREVDQDIT